MFLARHAIIHKSETLSPTSCTPATWSAHLNVHTRERLVAGRRKDNTLGGCTCRGPQCNFGALLAELEVDCRNLAAANAVGAYVGYHRCAVGVQFWCASELRIETRLMVREHFPGTKAIAIVARPVCAWIRTTRRSVGPAAAAVGKIYGWCSNPARTAGARFAKKGLRILDADCAIAGCGRAIGTRLANF